MSWFFKDSSTKSTSFMDRIVGTVAKTLKTDTATASGIVIAGVVGLITLLVIIFLICRRRSARGNTVLLVGLTESGKTLMFRQFVTGGAPDPPETYTSMKENSYTDLAVESKSRDGKSTIMKLVDFPGAEKLRKRLFSQYLAGASHTLKAIVYVVDSATFPKLCKDVAELFYEVLCELDDRVPVLVACTKQDMPLAKSSQVIRSGMEKEFSMLNRSRSAALESTDEREGTKRKVLGSPDRDFKLDHLKRTVEFCECSSKQDSQQEDSHGLESVENWLGGL